MILHKVIVTALLLGASAFQFAATVPDEGMFPLSDLNRAGLKKAGLKISEKDIYNPGSIGLVDALVRVGGCSGSFVSGQGLIITNHHCAFSAVQLASTPQHNYLENGFVAHQQEQEIEAKGLTIRITDSYEDVSKEVLDGVKAISDPLQRIEAINQKRQELARKAEQADPTIKAEVSEMFIGKSYVLFKYKTIEDVRLVYVPKQNIGEFGFETDNWVWPRHTGDYSFLRAYVAKDGSSAAYSKDNVPYGPKKHLKVNPKGVEENDFVFILGYPGRTFRHRPAQYIDYQEKFLLPYTSELYDFENQRMEDAGKTDKAVELALATRIKRNANVLKNYRGKLKGLRNIDLVQTKRDEDAALAKFIDSRPDLKSAYGNLMTDIEKHYDRVFEDAPKELWMNNIYHGVKTFNIASYFQSFQDAIAQQASPKAQQALFDQNINKFNKGIHELFEAYHLGVDQQIARHLFAEGAKMQGANALKFLRDNVHAQSDTTGAWIAQLLATTRLNNEEAFRKITSSPASILAYKDELLDLHRAVAAEYATFSSEQKRREGMLNKLMGDYVAVREQFMDKNFVPDANSTLRLTFGNIKGYSPADATYMQPFTSVKGLLEKGNSGLPEFGYPHKIKEAWLAKDFGSYMKKDMNDVPVNILYNMDTTGGNSGSPIMNANGELIGVNFDRAYDATINDFAWNESYSRSIGVDIRFVLWVADKIDNAQFILKEMGVH
ncbi:S46 family peptidase [Sphingobacterium sp. lm-10]|uniref:S46 family peptidase n=1 Tax=Sphingobacterium sp. lm-10 TaxID=2944904 RepID=UPI0020204AE7|nr:S46 family peptidase [Sphingobacterium sp. lm-10]MCL7986515.1 S46 family peptidase [Sphingobacterium sp. lm-10]